MSKAIMLPSDFNIGVIHDVTEEIKGVISAEDEIILDAKEVETIDILGIQLVVCIVKTVLKSDIKLNIINIKPELQKYFSFVSLPMGENINISRNDVKELNYIKDIQEV